MTPENFDVGGNIGIALKVLGGLWVDYMHVRPNSAESARWVDYMHVRHVLIGGQRG